MVGATLASPTVPRATSLCAGSQSRAWIQPQKRDGVLGFRELTSARRPRAGGRRNSGELGEKLKAEKEGRGSDDLAAVGTADCAEPMATAGRGGTKFPLANDDQS